VPLDSALGVHFDPARTLAFPDTNRFVAHQTDHLGLLSSPAVAAALCEWLG
jgi:hypothetical protein